MTFAVGILLSNTSVYLPPCFASSPPRPLLELKPSIPAASNSQCVGGYLAAAPHGCRGCSLIWFIGWFWSWLALLLLLLLYSLLKGQDDKGEQGEDSVSLLDVRFLVQNDDTQAQGALPWLALWLSLMNPPSAVKEEGTRRSREGDVLVFLNALWDKRQVKHLRYWILDTWKITHFFFCL